MNTRRGGFALLATVAALALIEIAVLGVLLLCMQAEASSRDSADLARARAGAEAAVREATAHWDESVMRTLAAGVIVAVPGAGGQMAGNVRYRATAERLHGAAWLLRGVGMAGSLSAGRGERARSRSATLLTAIPLAAFVADFYAPLVSGGATDLAAGTVIDATQATSLPPFWSPADCAGTTPSPPPARPALALGSAGSIHSAAMLTGTPPVLYGAPRADSADFERVGGLLWAELAVIADRVESGAVNLAPATAGGACDTAAPGNWGAPADSAHPCFDYFPLVYAAGPLRIDGGHGQGILAVDGVLTFAPGSRFTGVIVARGLDADQAEILGSVRVQGSARVSATLRFSECAAGRALHRSPALRKLYRASDRWWLPGFD